MKTERHKTAPGQLSPLRALDITASDTAALFGLHPYKTAMGLFADKTGAPLPREDDSIAQRRGRLLEDAVARAFLEAQPLCKLKAANIYIRAPLLRFGCSPDFFLIDEQGRKGVAEMKTAAPHIFKKQYTDQTPPTHHMLQCLSQMMLTNSDIGVLAVLVIDGYRFDLHTYDIPRHPAAERRIQDAVAQFWSDIDAGRTPNLDYARDGSLLPVLFPHHVEGKVVDLRSDNALPALLDEREQIKDEITAKIARKDAIETELKFKMADAEAAMVAGWRITHRDQHRKEHTVRAADFRVLRIARESETAKAIAAA
jgi:predicted phage-related endonuclease